VHALRPTAADVRELVLYFIAFLLFLGAALAPKGGVVSQGFRALNAGGVLMGFLAMLSYYLRRRRLFKATLLVPSWPLRLGDTVTLRFRAMLKKTAVSTLAAKLQCVEQVTIGQGRGQQKANAVAYELELPCSKQERRVVEEEWTLTIPTTLPPSMDVYCNTIRWRIAAMLMDVPAEFTLLVIPEVAE
jgi:hypothetical protein